MEGGTGDWMNSVLDVKAGVCWLYKASGINYYGLSDEKKGKLSRGGSS